jgi:hypothetical protein
MKLSYRPDWPEAADRLARWWAGESLGRPAMSVTAPRDRTVWRELPAAPDLWEHWTNPDFVVPRAEQAARNTACFGEACPQTWVNLGPVSCAGYLGTTVYPRPDTVWHGRIVEDWNTYEPRFDPDTEWWRVTKRVTEALIEAAEGKWFIGSADLGDVADVMSYLRGPEALCLDLIEGPRERMEWVRDRLLELLCGFYDELAGMVNERMDGTSSWLGVWHPGRTTTLQCDFSCMISKELFDDFCAPPIAEQARRLDRVIYHLDGPGALQHVDTVVAFPNLHAIQWVPGAGNEREAHPRWRPLLKRIMGAGVRVHLSVAPQEIEGLLNDLPADGLYLSTSCPSEIEARDLLAAVERWSRVSGRAGARTPT